MARSHGSPGAYGVNFVLGTGLHSYGFGSGGYAYIGAFVAFEVLVIVGALLRYRSQAARRALAVPSGVLLAAHRSGWSGFKVRSR